MNSFSVCAIVLNWNGTKDTLECLQSLFELNPPVKTIVLVDNASSDNPREKVLDWAKSIYPAESIHCYGVRGKASQNSNIPAFTFIQNTQNEGYAGGNNSGIRYAMSAGVYDYIWILNNDTVVSRHSLKNLIEYSDLNPEAGVIGSTVVYHAQRDKIQCAGGCRYNPWTTTFYPVWANRSLDKVLRSPYSPRIDYVYGAAMFVRTSVFQKCGLLNDAYFLFYEEIDFCKKAKKAGHKLAWCKNSIVYHKVSQSLGQVSSGDFDRSSFTNYHENLSTLIYSKRFNPLIFPVSMLSRFIGKMAFLAKRKELYLIVPLLHAYADFFRGRNQRDKYSKCQAKLLRQLLP